MVIGIIVYSHTGHTLSVAKRLKARLTTDGHQVSLVELQTVVPLSLGATTAALKTMPNMEQYDTLLLGTPVRGGVPSPPMKVFLEQTVSFGDRKIVCFVTGVFRAEWGRNQTIALMKAMCEAREADVIGMSSVGWWSFGRKRKINAVVDSIATLFK